MDPRFDGWPHIVEAQQFSRAWIEKILFPLTAVVERKNRADLKKLLFGNELISLFYGESLRTRASFEIAIRRLGGEVAFGSEAAGIFSSFNTGKQEALVDIIAVLNEFGADAIVLRSANEGDAANAAAVSQIPIINAGDGAGQHPTQALLDLYTIYRYFGGIDGISIALMGDLTGSRTVHSLAYLLGKFKDVSIYFVSPSHKRIRPDIIDHLHKHKVRVCEAKDIRIMAGEVDVIYQTRTQNNLGTEPWDRRSGEDGCTMIDAEVLNLMRQEAIIMHPLPCRDEIDRPVVDSDPRAVYIKTRGSRISQVRCGILTRMAELLVVTDPSLCCHLLR